MSHPFQLGHEPLQEASVAVMARFVGRVDSPTRHEMQR